MSTLSVWKLIPLPDKVILEPIVLTGDIQTLDGASLCLPGGAYTTLRTYHSDKVLHFGDHLRRLGETAELSGLPQRLDEQVIRKGIRQLLEVYPKGQDFRIRLTLDLEHVPGELYFLVERLVVPPPMAYQKGVKVTTCDIQRQLPKAKLTRFIDRSAPLRQSLPPDVNEAIMVDAQDHFLEGLSSNFFAILDGVIWTAEKDVLSGITRGIVIECARHAGLPLRLDPPRREDMTAYEEAFITSSSRGVLPVCQIDQSKIGTTCPGSITGLLMDAYNSVLEDQVESI
jgi:branched-chain amino acid aminotransferase